MSLLLSRIGLCVYVRSTGTDPHLHPIELQPGSWAMLTPLLFAAEPRIRERAVRLAHSVLKPYLGLKDILDFGMQIDPDSVRSSLAEIFASVSSALHLRQLVFLPAIHEDLALGLQVVTQECYKLCLPMHTEPARVVSTDVSILLKSLPQDAANPWMSANLRTAVRRAMLLFLPTRGGRSSRPTLRRRAASLEESLMRSSN